MARLRETRAGGDKSSRKLGTHTLKKRNSRIIRARARVAANDWSLANAKQWGFRDCE